MFAGRGNSKPDSAFIANPVSRTPNRESGYRDMGIWGYGDQRKPARINVKRVLIAVGLPADFLAFLLVFECEAVEAFTNFKRHGDLVDLVALYPSSEVVSFLD